MIDIKNIKKSYNSDVYVLDDFSIQINEGEFVVFLGPSGCGKTTLLKMINKLINYNSGEILVKNKNIKEWNTIKLRRSIGYVIQQIGLFPHMTIEENIGYVLSLEKKSSKDRYEKVSELIEMVGMEKSMLKRFPRELSGGQRQRIGVARALAAEPDIILMDEPFGAVDEIARTLLQDELKTLQQKLNKTILFVTHDIEEALKLGTKIVLLNNGKIEQIGTPEELLFKPKSEYVKEFFGLKGFKSILDNNIMSEIYKKVLKNNMSLGDLHKKLSNI